MRLTVDMSHALDPVQVGVICLEGSAVSEDRDERTKYFFLGTN